MSLSTSEMTQKFKAGYLSSTLPSLKTGGGGRRESRGVEGGWEEGRKWKIFNRK